jgi:hypothetical protein
MLESEVTPVLQALREEWPGCCRDPSPHDGRPADDRVPALLGHRAGRELATGFKAAVNELGKHGAHIEAMNRRRKRPCVHVEIAGSEDLEHAARPRGTAAECECSVYLKSFVRVPMRQYASA